jgi:hypothetical protein
MMTINRYTRSFLPLLYPPIACVDCANISSAQKITAKTKTPQSLDSAGFPPPYTDVLAETEGFEPSIQVLAQMLP